MLPSHDPNIPQGRNEFNMKIPRGQEALTNSGTEFNEFKMPNAGYNFYSPMLKSKPAIW